MKVIGSGPSEKVRRIAERVNSTSNADFVRRLLDERRKVILNPDGSVSTHELGYRDDGEGNAVVYPLVQSVNGGNAIHRFDDEMAYDRALYNGDTLLMSTPEAKAFTEGYKEVYPGFDQYAPVPGMAVGSRYMPQWSPEVDLLGPYFSGKTVLSESAEPDLFSEEALERRALKQRYAESGFRDNAVSGAGAQGAWQIMPITLEDYLGRGKGKKGDLNDPAYNRKVRDWVMEIIPKSLGEFYSEDDDPRVRLAKIYGAYNWGAGNMRKYLRKQKEKGVDIAKDTSWVEGLNPETKRYIKYLALDEDIEGSPYTTEKFEEAARKKGYLAEGGSIHIKPENRGKFTALKKRTGHSASWFKAHGTPAQKKMAVFELNSRKWNHGDGGLLKLFDGGGDTEEYGIPYYPQNTSALYPGMSYSEYLYTVPEVTGGSIDPAVVTAALPAKFNGSQEAARRYAEGYQKGAKPVSEAMSRAGQDIYKVADTVAGFVPGPIGAINWLGHMGADVANGEYGKVAKDVALAAAMGLGLGAASKGIGYLKNSWDDAFNFGEDVFRAFTDSAPASVSHAVPAANVAAKVAPAVSKAVSAPYEIETLGGGYMLKSLMRGNPLEKQISKNGTVNVNNIRALVNKGSKVEKAVVDKVLASEEFAGQKAVDYNKFRKAVQDELITYERTLNTKWSDYGLDRIGLSFGNKTDIRNAEDRMDMLRERIATGRFRNGEKLTESDIADAKSELEKMEAFWRQIPETETYTFSSPRIPYGSAKHYDSNTLGHSRTYTTADEPNVLHVMESQSDWGQGYKKMNLDGEYNQKRINSLERRINNLKESINSEMEGLRTEKMNDGSDMSPWFADSLRKQIEKDKQLLEELTVELDMRRNPKSATQQDYLAENFTSRQIQENLRYAAEKGQTKMRYPTKETAAKIEGYPKETNYYDADGNLVTDSRKIYTIGKENEKELDLIQSELDGYYAKFNVAQLPNGDYVPAGNYSDNPYQQLIEAIPRKQAAYDGWRKNHPNATSEKGQRKVDEMKQRAEEIKNFRLRVKYLNQRMKELRSIKPYVDPSIKEEVKYMHEDDILRKYNEFPKQFKKLFKGADVRIVTDPKGNTWYEVDVPEDYLRQEWAYADGGSMILPRMMMDKYHPDKIRQAIAKIRAGK